MYKIKVCAQVQQLENEMLIYRKYERTYRITEKGLRFLRLYGELRQMISSKQKDRIREQDTFESYRWPFQIATFTNPFWVRGVIHDDMKIGCTSVEGRVTNYDCNGNRRNAETLGKIEGL
jgi:hypothetical protein